MAWLGVTAAGVLIFTVLIDAFEVMILPRRVAHRYSLARFFYRATWTIWGGLACRLPAGRWRNGFLSIFGPVSLFALLNVWAVGLLVGFALLYWSMGVPLAGAEQPFSLYL